MKRVRNAKKSQLQELERFENGPIEEKCEADVGFTLPMTAALMATILVVRPDEGIIERRH